MTLKIGSSITGGFRRIANRNGAVLLSALTLLAIVWQVTFTSFFLDIALGDGAAVSSMTIPPMIDAPTTVLAAGALLSILALTYLNIVAIRTFVSGATRSIPSDYFTRRIGVVFLNTVVGGIVFGLLVFLGSILLIIPGIIAYVAFIFTTFYIAVEDENFVAALRHSWTLTRGNWLKLFGLLLIVIVGFGAISTAISLAATAAGQPIETVVTSVVSLAVTVVTLGILSEAFNQLRAGAGSTTPA